MKNKYLAVLLIILSVLFAIPTNDTDIVKNKDEISSFELTTFKEPDKMFDGVISSKPEFSVNQLTNGKENQNVVIKLKHPFYIRKIVISLDKDASCKNIIARYSKNTTSWVDFEDISSKETAESIQYTITGHNVLVNYLAFVFVANPAKTNLIVQEIQVFPEMEIRLRERYVKDNWLSTDRECFNDIDTKIDTVKFMKFSKVGAPADDRYKRYPSPVLEGELFSVDNLEPGTPYEYIMSVTDYNGNILELAPRQFMTRPLSLAYNKPVEGTFTDHYNGTKIAANNPVVTNGSFDINKGLAISGPVNQADQYIVIDLGQSKYLTEIVTMWRNLGYSKDFSILVSDDKQNWKTAAEHQNAELNETTRVSGHPVRILSTKFATGQNARYIKILAAKGSDHYSKHGTGRLELFELKAF